MFGRIFGALESHPCHRVQRVHTLTTLICVLLYIHRSNVDSYLQNGPLDLFSDHFYENRKAMIDARLKWILSASSEVHTLSMGALQIQVAKSLSL